MTEPARYRVSMPRPHTHLFEVEARFPGQDVLEAVLPVWTPGSYLVREYARHVQQIMAVDEAGAALPVERVDKRTWRVQARGRPVTLRYRVYANELTVRTSHLDGSHGYFNGASLFLYAEALRGGPQRLVVEAPPGWSVFTALDGDGEGFVAPDYDTLVDSPVEVGPHTPLRFTAAGVPHEVVVWGGAIDRSKLETDLRAVCEAEAALWGGLPFPRYLFLIYLADKGRGGLEHGASTALIYGRQQLTAPKGWEDFLTLASHEYFHAWNVKRLKPRAFVPFDYAGENYTRLLWAFEGITSYYDNLLVRRAGRMSGARYLCRLGEAFSVLLATPGRMVQTLEEASLTAWVKYYRQDENTPNSAVSYYLKGELVALCLDLEIRRATADAKSLDDVMRLLWTRYGDGRGVPESGVEEAAVEIAGGVLRGFFDRALRSTADLDTSVLEHVGLQLRTRIRESASDKGGTPPRLKPGETPPRGWTGIVPRGPSICSVLEGSPAQTAGLYPEDEVVAIDGIRGDAAALVSRSDDRAPGQTVRVTVFRRDLLVDVPVTLGQRPEDAVWLAPVEAPTEAQRASFERWLGTGLEMPA
jgi:predicted metalloprotease with PDZ domain